MNFAHCPKCSRPLPALAMRCAQCGQLFVTPVALSPVGSDDAVQKDDEQLPPLKRQRAVAACLSSFFRSGTSKTGRTPTYMSPLRNPLTLDEPDYHTPDEHQQVNSSEEQKEILHALRPEPQTTWQKVVEAPADSPMPSYPPRPTLPLEKPRVALLGSPIVERKQRYFLPKLFFWGMSGILTVFLVTIGVISALGHGLQSDEQN